MPWPALPSRQMLTALVAALAVLVLVLGVAVIRGPLANRAGTPTAEAGVAPTSANAVGVASTPTSGLSEPRVETAEAVASSLASTPLATAVPTPPNSPVIAAPPLIPGPTTPVQPPTSSVHPTLAAGATGAPVADLQRRLNRWITTTHPAGLAPLAVDGIFGTRTAAVVRAFQQAQGLPVDGIVGPQTWRSLLAVAP